MHISDQNSGWHHPSRWSPAQTESAPDVSAICTDSSTDDHGCVAEIDIPNFMSRPQSKARTAEGSQQGAEPLQVLGELGPNLIVREPDLLQRVLVLAVLVLRIVGLPGKHRLAGFVST